MNEIEKIADLERQLAEARRNNDGLRETVAEMNRTHVEQVRLWKEQLAARDAAIGEALRRGTEDVACGDWCGVLQALRPTPTPSPRMMKGCGNTETCLHPCDHGEDHKECGDCQNSDQSNNCPKCEPVEVKP